MEAHTRRHSRVVPILLAVSAGLASSAGATSYATFPVLSGATNFKVLVLVQSEGKDYPPGIDDLEVAIRAILVEALRGGGLRHDDSSALQLIMTVEFSYEREKSEWVAVAMGLDLYESATVGRSLPKRVRPERTVVTWSTSSIDLIRASNSRGAVLSRAGEAASWFVSCVNQVNKHGKPN